MGVPDPTEHQYYFRLSHLELAYKYHIQCESDEGPIIPIWEVPNLWINQYNFWSYYMSLNIKLGVSWTFYES